ncbi:HlyD family secretion protein [Marinomonas ostreistagni]|uniref:HlyD family secretion protein n=1 Tax=Marinomonas ostreistagni TaxID=359209 RepID=A0ABS0Z7P6_9GAMM|nr:HlyD family secretion protein [Marinomonas ostreistagni]MBJ7549667.1 HlyD family secretion protein [Marinomonas ostreistagni]
MKKTRYAVMAVVAVAIVGASAWQFNTHASNDIEQLTEDAYVQADLTVISPRISGAIDQVFVSDYVNVKEGDSLVHIDERDLDIARQVASANVLTAQSVINVLQAEIVKQHKIVEQAQAVISLDKARLSLAEANRTRFINLARDGSGTVQDKQQAETDYQTEKAIQMRDEAALATAKQQVLILEAQLKQAQANLLTVETQLKNAELAQSYAAIKAPVSGMVAQVNARNGSYVNTGQSLLTIVPMDKLYIEAQYRETQLANVHEGQAVTVKVDALPGVELKGRVDHIAPASLVSYSPIAPHNATGNFTKIVQRIPVRIKLLPDQSELLKLRIGMSVVPVIHTNQKI